MSRIVFKGKINGPFRGFNSDELFVMSNGTYWIQKKYKYWYHYKYRPDVEILEENGEYILNVEGNSIPIRKIDVIKSQVSGKFTGCEGHSTFELVNGQIWKQSAYKYEYKYAYMPDAIIYDANGKHIMLVEDMKIEVVRIK